MIEIPSGAPMSNIQTAYNYFVSQGLSPAASAGIVGNLEQESGLNPEYGYNNPSGEGIAQWMGSRRNPNLVTGNPSVDLQNQLQYITQELQANPSYGLAQLEQASTPAQAADIFSQYYERPGTPDLSNRENYAVQVYQAAQTGDWAATVQQTGTLTSATTSSTSDVGGGFLHSFNVLLNPNTGSINPISDTVGMVKSVVFRGLVAVTGLLIMAAGLAIIVFGFLDLPGIFKAVTRSKARSTVAGAIA